MGLFDFLKSKKKVLVVDGLSLNGAMGMKGDVAPRNQLQVLRRLSRFAEREKVEVVVVLSGTPLNKAPKGEKFEEVLVLYSASAENHAKYASKVARSKGKGAILVSSNAKVQELAAQANLATMRVSTFRKAFDTNGNGGDNNGERSQNGGRNRTPRRRTSRSTEPRKAEQKSRKPAPTPAPAPSQTDAINELIDLVD